MLVAFTVMSYVPGVVAVKVRLDVAVPLDARLTLAGARLG